MVHLVIVDDHAAVRTGVAALLAAEPDLTVEATVATGADAETACESHHTDVLVADYHLPDLDGLSLCLRLHAADGPAVVLYSAFADDGLAVLAMVAGARALVPKSAAPAELISAVYEVAQGTRALRAPASAALQDAGERLDPEDLPILGMLTAGVDPTEIARTLDIPDNWLTTRRWAMLERLRARPPRRATNPPGRPGIPAAYRACQ